MDCIELIVKERKYSTAHGEDLAVLMTSWTQRALTILIKEFLKRCHGQDFTGFAFPDALDEDIEHHEKIQTIKMSASKD
eukprot:4438216-Karenia_brevis.AAC.1